MFLSFMYCSDYVYAPFRDTQGYCGALSCSWSRRGIIESLWHLSHGCAINPLVKGILPWEHRQVRKRYSNPMVTSAESKIHSVSENFPQKAMRLALRLLLALSLVAAITFVFVRLIHVNATSVGFFYLVAILVIATVGGLLEASVSSVVAMLCFNFFFLPPIGTFTIADPQNWVALFAFVTTALTASQLSARLKRQRREALDRQREMERLYTLSRAILLTDTTQPTAKQIAHQIAHAFECPAVALYDRNSHEVYVAGPEAFPNIDAIDAKLRESAIQSSVLHEEGDEILITPIRLGGEPIGSLAVKHAFMSDAALQSLISLVAVGLEKARAQEEANRAQVARQSEELKSTLLDAIAHEFKTPLTSIKAVTTDLLSNPEESLSQQQRGLVTIADEGANHRRINRLHSHHLEARFLPLDHFANAGDRATGSHAHHHRVYAAIRVLPNLHRRPASVNFRVGGIVELLRHERVLDFLEQLFGFADRAGHSFGARCENQLGPEHPQQHATLHAHCLRHRQGQPIPFCRANKRQRNTGIAGC